KVRTNRSTIGTDARASGRAPGPVRGRPSSLPATHGPNSRHTHRYKRASMSAKIIDGKAIAHELRAEYYGRVHELKSRHGVTPALAVILVGDNPASRSYVRNKIAGCREVGIRSELIE